MAAARGRLEEYRGNVTLRGFYTVLIIASTAVKQCSGVKKAVAWGRTALITNIWIDSNTLVKEKLFRILLSKYLNVYFQLWANYHDSLLSLLLAHFPPSHLFAQLRRFEPPALQWLCGCCCHLLMSRVMMWGWLFPLKWRRGARTQSFHFSKTKCDSDNRETSQEREAATLSSANQSAKTFLKWWHASGKCSEKLPVFEMKGESASCQLLTCKSERFVAVWASCCSRRCRGAW